MTSAQRLIKFFAVFLAGVLIVGICAAAVGTIAFIGMAVGVDDGSVGEMSQIWKDEKSLASGSVRNLKVDVGATEVKVEAADENKEVSVETDLNYIETSYNSDILRIKEKSHFGLTSVWRRGKVLIRLPKNYVFDTVEIEVGAGVLAVDGLVGEDLRLELGAGRTEIRNLTAKREIKIDGGAGYLDLKDSVLNNLDLDLGAGRSEVAADITGESKISSGVGSLELKLPNKRDEYQFRVDKGLGSLVIDGEAVGDGKYGNGKNELVIDSGVGAVTIKTAER